MLYSCHGTQKHGMLDKGGILNFGILFWNWNMYSWVQIAFYPLVFLPPCVDHAHAQLITKMKADNILLHSSLL